MADRGNPDTATPDAEERTTLTAPVDVDAILSSLPPDPDDDSPWGSTNLPGPEMWAVLRNERDDGHPNTVAYSSGAVCCPTEASARRHTHRAAWWQHRNVERHVRDGQWIGSTITVPMRRWSR